MSERFRAILIDKSDRAEKGQSFRFAEMTETELMDGDVTIAVEHSSDPAGKRAFRWCNAMCAQQQARALVPGHPDE